MRPSSADTSEPACVKRKMLSTNSSTSLFFGVAEVLGHRQRRQRHAQTRARRLGHLAVDQRRARLRRIVRVDDAALLELEPEVVAFARALADAGEHRHAAVLHGDVVDELHDDDGLADAGAAEEPDLAALQVRLEQVDDLDAGLEHLQLGRLVLERRRRRGESASAPWRHRAIRKVHRLAEHVHARGPASRGRPASRSARPGLRPSMPRCRPSVGFIATVRTRFSPRCCSTSTMRSTLSVAGLAGDANGVVDRRQMPARELDVDDRSDDLDDLADLDCFSDCHVCALSSRDFRTGRSSVQRRSTAPARPTRPR